MRTFFLCAVLCGGIFFPGLVRAGESDPFAGMIVGSPLTDDELDGYTGRGLGVDFPGGVNNGAVNATFASTVASDAFGNARGILQITQFNGDGNIVNIGVTLEININTTTITGSSGLSVGVTNGFSLSASTVGVGAP